jgi:hypothetical protein
MKKTLRLPLILRTVFGTFQILICIAGGALALVFLLSFTVRTPAFPLFFTANLEPSATPISLKSSTADAKDIRVSRVTTDLALNFHSNDPKLAAAIRQTLLPEMILSFISAFFMLGQLRKLCARSAQGEVFSEANLRSIRSLGLIFVVTGFAGIGFHFWTNHQLIAYLNEHVDFTGIGAGVSAGNESIFEWIGSLLTGLLVMILTEVFRQGLALQKENDLTV